MAGGVGREIVNIDNGITKLWGTNVGPYPKHHFSKRWSDNGGPPWPLRLQITGEDEWVAGCQRFRKNCCIFSVEYVQQGIFTLYQNGRNYEIGPGEIFFLHLGKDNEMGIKGDYASKRTIIAAGESLHSVLFSLGLDNIDVLKTFDTAKVDQIFDRARCCFLECKPEFMKEASMLVYELLLTLGEGVKIGKMPPSLHEALVLFESNLGQSFATLDLPRHCGCSSMTLRRLFRKHFHTTPIEYFIGMKMAYAKEALCCSPLSIKELSRQLGYSNQLYFSAEFKKRLGLSPKSYRLKRHFTPDGGAGS